MDIVSNVSTGTPAVCQLPATTTAKNLVTTGTLDLNPTSTASSYLEIVTTALDPSTTDLTDLIPARSTAETDLVDSSRSTAQTDLADSSRSTAQTDLVAVTAGVFLGTIIPQGETTTYVENGKGN